MKANIGYTFVLPRNIASTLVVPNITFVISVLPIIIYNVVADLLDNASYAD